MPTHRRRHALAASVRYVAQKYAMVVVLVAAVGVVSYAQNHQNQMANVRTHVTDAVLPLADIIHAPLNIARNAAASVREWRTLYDTNAVLTRENAALRDWQREAERLSLENARLQKLLRVAPSPQPTALTAKVVSEAGGAFQNSLLALAGIDDGVDVGSVVMGESAVVGRVTEVGNRAARILLISDENSRLPVQLESSGERAIMAGTGRGDMRLDYLPDDVTPTVGERVLTSGHGGIFPAGLPVGQIVADGPNGSGGFKVVPLERLGAQQYVRIVDFRAATDTGKPD